MASAPRGGVGIEVTPHVIRGVRIGDERAGRISTAAEFPVHANDADSLLDGLVLLKAELGGSDEPARVAIFPTGTMLQRVDVTGRTDSDLRQLRVTLHREHRIATTVRIADGPRRWMVLIRWDEDLIDRLDDFARRAGFVELEIEPTPMSVARVAGPNATYVRRLTARGDAHHAVVGSRLPVAALSTVVAGRAHPDIDIATVDVNPAMFDELQTDDALAQTLDRVASRAADVQRSAEPSVDGADVVLDLAGVTTVPYPDHDVRSSRRQVAALGAAVAAAGLVAPIPPLDRTGDLDERERVDDRPWAIEMLPAGTERDDQTSDTRAWRRRFGRRQPG